MLYAVCILDQEIGKTFALHHIKTNGFFYSFAAPVCNAFFLSLSLLLGSVIQVNRAHSRTHLPRSMVTTFYDATPLCLRYVSLDWSQANVMFVWIVAVVCF
jgi:hypothetical protein